MIHPLAFYRIFLKNDRIKLHGRHLTQNKTKLIWKLQIFFISLQSKFKYRIIKN